MQRDHATLHGYRLLIALLLGAFLLFSGWAAYRAMVQGSSVTDTDYYGKGLKYSGTRAEEQAAAALGWHIESNLTQGRLSLELSDNNKLPVANAEGSCTRLTPPVGPSVSTLQEGPAGTYHLAIPPEWRGETLLHLDFSRGEARFSRRLLLHLGP